MPEDLLYLHCDDKMGSIDIQEYISYRTPDEV